MFPEDPLSLCAQMVENLTKHHSHNYGLVGLRVRHNMGNWRSDYYLLTNRLGLETIGSSSRLWTNH